MTDNGKLVKSMEPVPPRMTTALFGVLDHHIEAVANYFASRPIDPKFNPDGRAPETSGKQRMMQERKSGPRLAVEEAIAEFHCDVINDDLVYVGALRMRAQDWSSGLTLPICGRSHIS